MRVHGQLMYVKGINLNVVVEGIGDLVFLLTTTQGPR